MRLVSFVGGFGRVDYAGDAASVIRMGGDIIAYLRDGLGEPHGERQPLDSVELLAPVPRPGKIICVGLNYRDHAKELHREVPAEPVIFAKFANSVAGPGAEVQIPPVVTQLDYEGELGVIMGRTARNVRVTDALNHVAGYTVVNDLSARDLQRRTGQWMRGKAIDGFLPMGPFLVTPDEVGDPQGLVIRTLVNGEIRQESSTAAMVFGVAELISFISQTMTLEAGDCIATGTPPGVGLSRTPPGFLHGGDEVVVEIAKVGRLVTRLVS